MLTEQRIKLRDALDDVTVIRNMNDEEKIQIMTRVKNMLDQLTTQQMEYEDIRSNLVRNNETVKKLKSENEAFDQKCTTLEQEFEC